MTYQQDKPLQAYDADIRTTSDAVDRVAQAEREQDFAFAYLMSAVKAILFDDSPIDTGREKYRVAESHFNRWLELRGKRP